MQITITGRHIEVTDAMREYASEKVAKLPRYFDRIQSIAVIADKHDSHAYEVEIIVTVEHADPFIGTQAHNDLYACIDDAVDKLERQLTDHKEKLRNRKHGKS